MAGAAGPLVGSWALDPPPRQNPSYGYSRGARCQQQRPLGLAKSPDAVHSFTFASLDKGDVRRRDAQPTRAPAARTCALGKEAYIWHAVEPRYPWIMTDVRPNNVRTAASPTPWGAFPSSSFPIAATSLLYPISHSKAPQPLSPRLEVPQLSSAARHSGQTSPDARRSISS